MKHVVRNVVMVLQKKNSINNIFVSYDVDTKLWFNLSAF